VLCGLCSVKVRAIAKGNMIDKDFFIIMDRLHGTLDGRINTWYHEEKRHSGGIFGRAKKKKLLRELMIERMTVAYDLAAAFFYLHENRLVYRDIKPESKCCRHCSMQTCLSFAELSLTLMELFQTLDLTFGET